ncbi:MAG: arginine--tRNA ligase, partial [Lentisphaeria bacterium]|nr:arginine--tRNA ligase [Lentisphaeria bacterium]
MKFLIDLEAYLRSEFSAYPAENVLALEACPAGQTGDFTLNCFRIGKFCGNPMAAAAAVVDFLSKHEDIESVTAVKAFVNITVKAAALHLAGAADTDALLERAALPEAERRRVLIEFSAPNTNKPQHLGHVRNNTLGMALGSLLKRVGNDVIEVNLVNDRGIHICKSMLCYQKVGNGRNPENTGIKGDHLVGDFYVEYNKMLSDAVKELKAARPELAEKDSDELFLETAIGQETQKMLQDWEAGVPAVRELWQMMNNWVFAGFAETYKRMGIDFNHTYLESETYLLGKDIIAAGLDKGVFSRREDGAVICDLGKMGKKVVLRSDGTSVYITQDIGTTKKKYDDYQPQTMIWVVGDEQNLHFQMLFEIMKRLGFEWAKDLFHLSYGMVNLPNGRMKSREGTVVDADDLFDEMALLARNACAERGGDEISEEELARRGEIIGLGALKFMLLKFNPKTTITFDPAASLRFEGDTGPYVQYVATRIASIERKAAEKNLFAVKDADWSLLTSAAEREVAVKLYFYPSVLQTAAAKRDCSGLVEYLLELAKAFNRFYRDCPVLSAGDEALVVARLSLADAVRKVITDGLHTLTIG